MAAATIIPPDLALELARSAGHAKDQIFSAILQGCGTLITQTWITVTTKFSWAALIMLLSSVSFTFKFIRDNLLAAIKYLLQADR